MTHYVRTPVSGTDQVPGPYLHQLNGLGVTAADIGRGVSTVLDSIVRGGLVQAAELVCNDPFQAAASGGIAQRTGIQEAGNRYRELARQAQRHCTAEGHRRAMSEQQEGGWITGAWVVAGFAVLGLGIASYLSLRTPAKRASNRRRRSRT
jgi:hypothetical protein